MSYSSFFIDWLKDIRRANSRIVLIEIDHKGVIYGLSDYPYSSDTLIYDDLVIELIEIEESFDAPSGVGDITFVDDHRNMWLLDDFETDECKLFLGDADWERDQFELVLSAVIENIECTEDNIYRINFDNTDYRLDKEIESTYINDQLIPFALGSSFNCRPILSDFGTQEYQFNSGEVTSIAVRDIGLAPASVTDDYAAGKIRLGNFPAGAITGDITEKHDTVIKAVDYLLLLSNVSSATTPIINLQGKEDYKIGWYSSDTNSYREVILEIIEPLGLTLRRNSKGVHELIGIEKSTPVIELDADDIFSISLSSTEAKKEKIELAYARNFTVQDDGSLALTSDSGLSAEDKARYGLAYKVLSKDTGAITLGKETNLRIDTLLTDENQATSELDHLVFEYKSTRKKWTIEVAAVGVLLQIGDTITINDSMLSDDVVVLSFQKDLSSQVIILEVMQ